jgi:hypothetical protein
MSEFLQSVESQIIIDSSNLGIKNKIKRRPQQPNLVKLTREMFEEEGRGGSPKIRLIEVFASTFFIPELGMLNFSGRRRKKAGVMATLNLWNLRTLILSLPTTPLKCHIVSDLNSRPGQGLRWEKYFLNSTRYEHRMLPFACQVLYQPYRIFLPSTLPTLSNLVYSI